MDLVRVRCDNAVHRIVFAKNGHIALIDHSIAREYAFITLGGTPPPCFNIFLACVSINNNKLKKPIYSSFGCIFQEDIASVSKTLEKVNKNIARKKFNDVVSHKDFLLEKDIRKRYALKVHFYASRYLMYLGLLDHVCVKIGNELAVEVNNSSIPLHEFGKRSISRIQVTGNTLVLPIQWLFLYYKNLGYLDKYLVLGYRKRNNTKLVWILESHRPAQSWKSIRDSNIQNARIENSHIVLDIA